MNEVHVAGINCLVCASCESDGQVPLRLAGNFESYGIKNGRAVFLVAMVGYADHYAPRRDLEFSRVTYK